MQRSDEPDQGHHSVGGPRILPLEEFGYPLHTEKRFATMMAAMLAGRWEKAGYLVTDMRPPINFDDHPRTHACDLHCWEPVGYALRAYEVLRDRRYLDVSCLFVFDWMDRYLEPAVSGRLYSDLTVEDLDRILDDNCTFAWYDMCVGRRIFRLAYLLDVLEHDPTASADRLRQLRGALQLHHALLGRDHFFRLHSNHGIHQALGQLAAARRFKGEQGNSAWHRLALDRLAQLFKAHFTDEGVHREHSPGYQYGIMVSLVGGAASGVIDDPTLLERFSLMERSLRMMILPDGRIAPLGDTDPKWMGRSVEFARQFADPGLRFQLSGGKIGTAPACGVAALSASGYAFARLRASDALPGPGGDSYLAQIAGFHSRVHKHADHLAFLWYDRGRDILIDPGRYAYAGKTEPGSDLFEQGFWYADPKRIYVESTRAHNCVEIDGRSHRRKGVRPFGSALRYAGEQDGLAVTDCEMVVERRVRHRRVLVMAPGHWLLVLDWLHDRTASHDFRQWFQFAPDWTLRRDGGTIRGEAPATDTAPAAALILTDLLDGGRIASPVRGQETPGLQGWMSDAPYSLMPSTSVALDAPRTAMGRFATLVVLEPTITVDRRATRFNATLRNGKVAWRDSRGSHALNVTLGEPGTVGVQRVIR